MMNLQRTLRIGLLCAAVILASALVLPAPHVTAGRTGAMLMQKETPTPAAEDAADVAVRIRGKQVAAPPADEEAEEEWDELMSDWDKFMRSAQLEKSAEEVGEAAKELGVRIKTSFDRLRKGNG